MSGSGACVGDWATDWRQKEAHNKTEKVFKKFTKTGASMDVIVRILQLYAPESVRILVKPQSREQLEGLQDRSWLW
jgi:hypothetical protein